MSDISNDVTHPSLHLDMATVLWLMSHRVLAGVSIAPSLASAQAGDLIPPPPTPPPPASSRGIQNL